MLKMLMRYDLLFEDKLRIARDFYKTHDILDLDQHDVLDECRNKLYGMLELMLSCNRITVEQEWEERRKINVAFSIKSMVEIYKATNKEREDNIGISEKSDVFTQETMKRPEGLSADMPWYEKCTDEEPDPYIFDGYMSVEDYERMHELIAEDKQLKSDRVNLYQKGIVK